MADVTIKVMKSGPYVITGDVEVLDHDGGAFPTEAGRPVALCRCGESSSRPFCDGTHSRCGFSADEKA